MVLQQNNKEFPVVEKSDNKSKYLNAFVIVAAGCVLASVSLISYTTAAAYYSFKAVQLVLFCLHL